MLTFRNHRRLNWAHSDTWPCNITYRLGHTCWSGQFQTWIYSSSRMVKQGVTWSLRMSVGFWLRMGGLETYTESAATEGNGGNSSGFASVSAW